MQVVADNGYQGAGPTVHVPQRRRRLNRDTGRYRRLSAAQREVNAAHARQRGPGERANAQLKNWKILRKIRSSPSRATALVRAVQTLIIVAEPGWQSLSARNSPPLLRKSSAGRLRIGGKPQVRALAPRQLS